MKIKKLLGFYTCIIIFIGLFINCAASMASYPVKVKDSKGNYLKFSQPPQRLVSLVPSATQILFDLGAKNFVKAVTHHDTGLAGAHGKQIIGGFLKPSLNKIDAVQPDMIILLPTHKDIIKKYKKTNVRLFIFQTDTLENSYKSIRAFGKIFNLEEQAEKIINKNKPR